MIRASLLVALLLGASPGAAAEGALPPALRPSAAQEAWIQRHVGAQQRRALEAIARSIARHRELRPSAERRWERTVAELQREEGSVDVDALVRWVLRESYTEQLERLRGRADEVERLDVQKKELRDELARLRRKRAGAASHRELGPVATAAGKAPSDAVRPPDEVDGRLAELEEELQELGEDSQLANLDLQNVLQRQRQFEQRLSALSKSMHDAAMAVIRKLGR